MFKLTNNLSLWKYFQSQTKVKHCYGRQVRIQTANLEVIARFMENWQIDMLLFNEYIAISLHKKNDLYIDFTKYPVKLDFHFFLKEERIFRRKSHEKYNFCSLPNVTELMQSGTLMQITNVKMYQ